MTFRRNFIAAAIAAVALSASFTAAAQNIVLKATDTHPAGYPTVVAVENMGKKLEAATNGRIKMQMFPGAVLGQEKEVVEQTQDRKSTRLNSSHIQKSRMPSSA